MWKLSFIYLFMYIYIIYMNKYKNITMIYLNCEDSSGSSRLLISSVPRFGSVRFEFIEPWTRTRTRTCPPCCFSNPNRTRTYNTWTRTEPEPMILELEPNPNFIYGFGSSSVQSSWTSSGSITWSGRTCMH